MTRTLVVSNFCTSLDWLKQYHEYVTPENTVIYSRTPDEYGEDYSHLGKYIKSPNVGENIYDMLRHIIENYDNLSDVTVFIKGNLFSRKKNQTHNHPKPGEAYEIDEFYYTTRENFVTALTINDYYPISKYFNEKNTPNGALFTQPVRNFDFRHSPNVRYKYFGHFHELSDAFFVNPPKREYVSFPPGGNYVVPRDIIKKYTKEFYKKLQHIVSWVPEPPAVRTSAESYLCERFLNFIWSEQLVEKNNSFTVD